MRINHNIAALNTYRQLGNANDAQSKSMEKLSSGQRINRAGDDAAGLAISEKMRGQIRGLDMASKNAQDGISMIATAEGALNETHSILQRMRELAVQSSNDTNTDSDRAELQKEVDQLSEEITRISNTTEFNTQTLMNGGIKEGNLGKLDFHIGANQGQKISIDINAMDAKSLGVSRDVITGTLDTTNTAKVASVKADSVDVANTLAAGTYTVTVANVAAGATADFTGTGLSDSGTLISGTPTADFTSTITYNDVVVGAAASIAAAQAGAAPADTLAFGAGANGAEFNGITIEISGAGQNGAPTASWDGANNKIVISLDNTTSANNTAANIQSAIQTLATQTKSDGTTSVDLSAVTVAGGGTYGAGGTALADATGFTSAAFAGGATASAANFTVTGDGAGIFATNASTTINGTTINFGQIAGGGAGTDGDSFTITGNATSGTSVQLFDSAGTTPIGSAVTIDQTNGGTYTIGNTTTGQLEVKFDAGQATVGSSTVTVASAASTYSALQADGTMSDAVSKGGINISTQTAADAAITTINNAIETVSAERSKLGAYQNRLDHTINNLGTSSENLTAAESRVRDVDMAKEMMEQTKQSILAQASQAMLAQANQKPQSVLQLLQ